MSQAQDDRIRAMMGLYREEKTREDRTKRAIGQVQANANDFMKAKMRLVEKLLDIQVKDEMQHLRASTNVALADVNMEIIKQKAREKIRGEVTVDVDKSREAFANDFMYHLETLSSQNDVAAGAEINDHVDEYMDPHIQQMRKAKAHGADPALRSVDTYSRVVATARRKEVEEQEKLKVRKDTHARVDRVTKAVGNIHKNLGDLVPLLQVRPVEYRTDIGVREAEINDLRKIIFSQRAEEERLLHERQSQMLSINAHREEIQRDVEEAATVLAAMQREHEEKARDLSEIAEAQQPYTGRWAVDTQQMERDVTYLCEEEHRLKEEHEERRRATERSGNEKALLDDDVNKAIQSLSTLQEQYQNVVSKIEEQLMTSKERIIAVRRKVTETTNSINDNRRRTVFRREDTRRQKRDLRAAINATISQMAIEERLHSVLMSRQKQANTDAEKVKAESDYQSAVLSAQLYDLKSQLKQKTEHISTVAEDLSDNRTSTERASVSASAGQLTNRVQQLTTEWALMEWDAATLLAQTASKIDLNTRENDSMLGQLGLFVSISEDLAGLGLDAEASPTSTLEQVHAKMYNELSMRSYREAKLNQAIRLLQERHTAAQRGEHVQPLTRNKRITGQEKKERREARERSRLARQLAIEQIKPRKAEPLLRGAAGNQSSPAGMSTAQMIMPQAHMAMPPPPPALLTFPHPAPGSSPMPASEPQSAVAQEHRLRVINFIKKEIQPLYDSNQITKKRFVDIVERVSTLFLQTHPAAPSLSDVDKREIVMKIQEVISWQDESKVEKKEDRRSIQSVASNARSPAY